MRRSNLEGKGREQKLLAHPTYARTRDILGGNKCALAHLIGGGVVAKRTLLAMVSSN